jgi:hypothetical protein
MVKPIKENKMLQEAESYGWVVESYEAYEAYNMACDYFGKEYVNDQIVDTLSDDELAASLAYLFRMWDFRQWDERDDVKDSLEDVEFDESIKRNKRKMKEGLSHSLEVKLQDFAQEYGKITYDDITKLGSCWDSLDASDKKEIQKLVSDVRKACKEAGMDAGELSSEYPEDKKTCDSLVKAVKGVCKSTKIKEARIGRTKEVKVLQGNWGYGWDDLCEYDKYDNGECRADLKAYMENDPTARYRVIFRRVPNKDYVEK